MAQYSYADIMKMQNDAARRVEEMQKRARSVSGLDEAPAEKPRESGAVTVKAQPTRVPMPDDYLEKLKSYAGGSALHRDDTSTESAKQNLRQGVLNLPEIDEDRALILSLVLLLAEENADETLLLALLYMLS